jgi:hypothetical protein
MLVFFGKRLAYGVYLNQEAENMEVHHHAHHGRMKSWRVYFWEFYAFVGVQQADTLMIS